MLLYIGEDDLALGCRHEIYFGEGRIPGGNLRDMRRLREAMGRRKPDLLLLDWNLPDGDGLELCRRIKSRKIYRR